MAGGDHVNLWGNPLNYPSIYKHIPALQERGVEVVFYNCTLQRIRIVTGNDQQGLPGATLENPFVVEILDGNGVAFEGVPIAFTVTSGDGTLGVATVTTDSNGRAQSTLTLGPNLGKNNVRVSVEGISQPEIFTAIGESPKFTLSVPTGISLIHVPLNVTAIDEVPLSDSRITRVTDLLSLEGIQGNVTVIIVWDNGAFKEIARVSNAGNIPSTGGQSFILTAQRAARVAISGNGWYNTSGTTAAPSLAVTGIEVGDATPVLALRGSIVDEVRVWSERGRDVVPTESGIRVTVKNLSTGNAVTAVTGDEHLSLPDKVKLIGVGYQLAVVDMESGRAARIGDVLEVSAETSNPLIRVRSLRYTVTAADVKASRIQLPELVAYEIPTETALLPNFPNPFNPETWIPYQLAQDAEVTLTIYDSKGVTVRRLDLGHQLAGYYADREKATYWDGRNNQGESVASGVYFYQLATPSFRQLRRMVIIK